VIKEKEIIETKIGIVENTIKAEESNNYGVENDTKYDKELIQKEKVQEIEKIQEAEKIIYDTNVKNIQDIFNKLVENSYDFVTVEPFDDFIKIIYRKDKIEKETLFIKYPAYTQILIKAKTLTQLKVDESDSSQE
jgi:type II secretory ATPase GspE/PulE/Tfp pilus assembly ATPase PilB-like protein